MSPEQSSPLHMFIPLALVWLVFYLLQTIGVNSDNVIRRSLPDLLQSDFFTQLTWRLLALGLLVGALVGGCSAFGVRVKPS